MTHRTRSICIVPEPEDLSQPTNAEAFNAALGLVVDAAAWVWDNILEGIFKFWGS